MAHDFLNDKRFAGVTPLEKRALLSSPTPHKGAEWKYIESCYSSGWLTTAGENIDCLEQDVGRYMGKNGAEKKAVALVNGTAAMHLAVRLAAEKAYHSSSGVRTPDGKGAGGSLLGRRVFVSDPYIYIEVRQVTINCIDEKGWRGNPLRNHPASIS